MSACTTGCGEAAAPGQEVCVGCEQLAERERQWAACLAAARVERREEGFVQGVKTSEGLVCAVGGCEHPAKAAGGRLCRACYARWRYWSRKQPHLTLEQFVAQGPDIGDAAAANQKAADREKQAAAASKPAPPAFEEPKRSEVIPQSVYELARPSFEERLLDRLLAATNWSAIPVALKRRIGEIVLEA